MIKNTFLTVSSLIFLASCGGGGGGSAPPLASINISSSSGLEVDIGTSLTISWTTSLAASCLASGDWSGSKESQGTFETTLSSAKLYTFTLTCLNDSGVSSSSSTSVTANYSIITGSVLGPTKANLVVYIDENHNRKKDSNELSDTTDVNGLFDIRTLKTAEVACLRDRAIRVESSYLMSLNPEKKSTANISPATSLFSDLTQMYIGSQQRNNILCEVIDGYVRGVNIFNGDSYLRGILNTDQYTYPEIEGTASTKTVSESKLQDLDKFHKSVISIGSALESSAKSYMDSLAQASGVSSQSGNFTWEHVVDLDAHNLRIFLNDSSSYPNPSTNKNLNASSIDAITVQFDYLIALTPSNSVPEANLNGWQDKYMYDFYGLHANNANEIINSTANCYVNFTSSCKSSVTLKGLIENQNQSFGDKFMMTKSTARGLESINWNAVIYQGSSDYNNCSISASYSIIEAPFSDSLSKSITEFVFYNNFTTSYDESEQECRDTYNPSVYARAKKFFEDGSYISITIDDESFDAMGRIVDPTNYLSDNLPPDDIPAIFVAVLNEIPLIPKDDDRSYLPTLGGQTAFNLLTQTIKHSYNNIFVRSSHGVVSSLTITPSGFTCRIYDNVGTTILNRILVPFNQITPCLAMPMDAEDTWANDILLRSPYPELPNTSSSEFFEPSEEMQEKNMKLENQFIK